MNTVTTVIEKKSEIARILFTTENEDIITELFEYTKKLVATEKKRPCQYADKEILQRVEQSEKQYKAKSRNRLKNKTINLKSGTILGPKKLSPNLYVN